MLWCTVHAPAGAAAGVHTGTITLTDPRAAEVVAVVAVEATVFGFTLPTTPAMRTAFDLSEEFIAHA